jgi:hypothetical protein
METENKTELEALSAKTHIERCPWCGKALTQGMLDGILSWICPDTEGCGYSRPV